MISMSIRRSAEDDLLMTFEFDGAWRTVVGDLQSTMRFGGVADLEDSIR